MYNLMLTLHVLLAIFAIGPLVHAASTAGRGIRKGDAVATAESARVVRIYTMGSVAVVIVGMGLMSVKVDGQPIGEFGDTWIWLSTLMWLVAVGLAMGVIIPTLEKATEQIKQEQSVVSMSARLAASGGLIALIFAAIVFIMVYQPGR